ncbi:MAG: glutamate--tRNA ligase [Hyphomicrobium sp.]|jgi:glutamyl-tRNA synthetase|nr:glutamate--tRNA ligase [Hyphomicrobium sp.]
MTPHLRFAPSPTGYLHFGNLRTAVLNYLFAMKNGGSFLLRLDDTDQERSSEAFAEQIRDDLRWLGFAWDREAKQSERTARYEEAAAKLKAAGRLYPCYETPEELERRRKRQLASGRPPIYDRAALKLTEAERARLQEEGRVAHWRFRLDNSSDAAGAPRPTTVAWDDLIRGAQTVDLGSLSDPVLIRADGTFLYTFTSVVDDIDFAITHVIRGEDHVTNTGVQIDLFRALGAAPPVFAHHALLTASGDLKMSKRSGDMALKSSRNLEPMAVASYVALIGTSDAIEPLRSMQELAGRLDLSHVSTAAARFDLQELKALNARYLHATPYCEVADRLAALGVGGGDAFWTAVRGNITVLDEAADWWTVVHGTIAPTIEDAEFLGTAAGLLPAEPWGETTWSEWTNAVKSATGAKGRALFHPLRLALTARESGPELKALLPLIGRDKALSRLAGEAS